jgi:oligopeptide transport system substrate-binding protein
MWKADVRGLHNNVLNVHPIREVVKGDGGGTLVLNNHTEIASLDPGISRGVSEHRVQICVFEGLLNYHPETLRPLPGVAEKYSVSSDMKTYTFHLRDCLWSDGKPVTAGDFEYAWKRVLDPATAADYAHMMYVLKGGEEFNTGKGSADGVGVRAKDDKTLVVELTNPVPYFPDLMPFFTFYPVRKDVIEKHGNEWTKPGKFVGNGPFRLKEWVTNEHIVLERNEKYWDAGAVKQREVRWLPTENATTAFNMYEKGQCDYLDTVPLEFIDEIRKRADFHGAPYLGTYYYSFNVTKKPFDDKRVRRALALAIDRTLLTKRILRGAEEPASTFVPPVFEDRGYRKSK